MPTDSTSIPETRGENQVHSTEDSGCRGNCAQSETESRQKDETEVQTPGDGEPILVGGAVVRPVILSRVEPKYTELARRVHLEGPMILQAIIDEQGRVVDARVLKGLSMGRSMGLEQEALDAVSRWRFRPATLHGRPVKVFYSLTVLFTLH
jgi:TonB family protein